MPILYGGNSIIPAPLVDISKEYVRTNDGTIIGSTFGITLQGSIICHRGSPSSSGFYTGPGYPPDEVVGQDQKLKVILDKQAYLRDLFSIEGLVLEIVPIDGSQSTICLPRLRTPINFPAGLWVDRSDYTIELECDELYGPIVPSGEDFFPQKLVAASESWQLEFSEQVQDHSALPLFRLSHNLEAQGKRFYDPDLGSGPSSLQKEAWVQARDWVLPRLGLDISRVMASGTLNLPSYYQGFNHVRSEAVDELGGSYSASESWLIASGNSIEEFSIESRQSADDGLTTVTVNGTVQGLDTQNATTFHQVTENKYAAASSKFNTVQNEILTRAQNYAGLTLNVEPLEKVIGRSPAAGTISYTYSFNDRPSHCISGVKSESITITENYPGQIVALIPVMGRAAGPVIQDIATFTERRRELNIECVVSTSGSACTYNSWQSIKPNVSGVILNATPVGISVYKVEDTENFEVRSGRYGRRVLWIYEV